MSTGDEVSDSLYRSTVQLAERMYATDYPDASAEAVAWLAKALWIVMADPEEYTDKPAHELLSDFLLEEAAKGIPEAVEMARVMGKRVL